MPELIRKATRDSFKRLILALGIEYNYREEFSKAGIEGVGFQWTFLSNPPPEKYLNGNADSHIDCYYRGIDWSDIRSVKRIFKVWESALRIGQHRYEQLTYSSLQLLNLDGFIYRHNKIGVIGKPPHIYGDMDSNFLERG